MKGIMERRDIASVTAMGRSSERKLVAIADNLALIRLFRWPAPYPTAQCKRYAAHNPFITNVAFGNSDDSVVISVGEDSTIVQWLVNT